MADETAEAAPALLGEQEFQRLLEAAAHSRYPCRDRALLHLFWDCGATVRQVVALEVGDVNFLNGRLQLQDGAREVRLPPDLLHLLTTYVSLERDPRCPTLFGGRNGRRLGPAQVGRLCRRLAAQTGIAVDPLMLRRAALARMLRVQPLLALGLLRGGEGPRAAAEGS
jgi:integrase